MALRRMVVGGAPGTLKLIGIGGGVGPAAGVALHTRILENTHTDGTDQSHFDIMHFSRSSDVLDRTKFLMREIETNPGYGMARTMLALNAAAESTGDFAVAGVPCNTFHAPEIWKCFQDHLATLGCSRVRTVHMLEETATMLKERFPQCKRVGLLSTTGTRETGVYRKLLEPMGFTVIEVDEAVQPELHESIYNAEWGIKAVMPCTQRARDNFVGYVNQLAAKGAEVAILGCTEIPLALPESSLECDNDTIPLVDPLVALAQALIHNADPARLKNPRPAAKLEAPPAKRMRPSHGEVSTT